MVRTLLLVLPSKIVKIFFSLFHFINKVRKNFKNLDSNFNFTKILVLLARFWRKCKNWSWNTKTHSCLQMTVIIFAYYVNYSLHVFLNVLNDCYTKFDNHSCYCFYLFCKVLLLWLIWFSTRTIQFLRQSSTICCKIFWINGFRDIVKEQSRSCGKATRKSTCMQEKCLFIMNTQFRNIQ